MQLKPGDRLESYEIRRLLARGKHGLVYEAHDHALGRAVALKVVPTSASGAELKMRAQAEARDLLKTQHGNLVRVVAAGALEGGLVYIATELLEGRSLRDVYRDLGRLTPAEMLVVGVQIARGIAAAHAAKIVHGDLRPETVFIQAPNEVKVLGLNEARFFEHFTPPHRADLSQSIPYLAPEQLRELGVTPRSDIFALGTILYEGLAGRPPAHGEPAPPLEEVTTGVPRFVARLIDAMVAKDAGNRPGSMREVAEVLLNDVRRLLEASSSRPRPLWQHSPQPDQPTPLPATLAAIDPTPPPAAATGAYEAQRPRFRALGVLALFGSVLAGAVIAVMVSRATRLPGEPVPASVPAVVSEQPSPPPVVASAAPSGSVPALPISASVGKQRALELSPVPAPSSSSSGARATTRQPWLD